MSSFIFQYEKYLTFGPVLVLEPRRDPLVNPYWIEDDDIEDGSVEYLDDKETTFWKDLIEAYLKPLETDKAKQEKVAQDLLGLRNKVAFAFLMVNALYVVVVFMLQIQKDTSGLTLPWPCWKGGQGISKKEVRLEPIGFVLLLFFSLVFVIQFLGMLFHRIGTLWHVLSTTSLNCGAKTGDALVSEEITNAIALAKDLGRLQPEDDRRNSMFDRVYSETDDEKEVSFRRRKTVAKLSRRPRRERAGTINAAFATRLLELKDALDKEPDLAEEDVCEKPSLMRRITTVRAKKQQRPVESDDINKKFRRFGRGKSVKAIVDLQKRKDVVFNENKVNEIKSGAQKALAKGKKMRLKRINSEKVAQTITEIDESPDETAQTAASVSDIKAKFERCMSVEDSQSQPTSPTDKNSEGVETLTGTNSKEPDTPANAPRAEEETSKDVASTVTPVSLTIVQGKADVSDDSKQTQL